jgi:predicted RNA-binding Zn-ribbon protein involved in translation (DUF1610 family)
MDDDPFFCEDCGEELGHEQISVASGVPRLDVESFAVAAETATVYQCSGCGMVIGFDPEG